MRRQRLRRVPLHSPKGVLVKADEERKIRAAHHRPVPKMSKDEILKKLNEPTRPSVKPVWKSAWCSTGNDARKLQAQVGKSEQGFHAGIATSEGRSTNVSWGPATPDEKSARMIAQSATAQALEARATERVTVPQIAPTRGRSH